MFRIPVIFLLLISLQAMAQRSDSLFVKQGESGWVIRHKIKAGETVFSLARKYHVPPAMLADFNNINYQQQLAPDSRISIPTGAYNIVVSKPDQANDIRPIYFRVDEDENLHRIARNTGVSQRTIQQWNNLYDTDISEGQVLQVGWLLYDATQMPDTRSNMPVNSNVATIPARKDDMKPAKVVKVPQPQIQIQRQVQRDTVYVSDTDTIAAIETDTIPDGEQLYMEQTNNGEDVVYEKGPAVFFRRAGKSTNGIFFAFHNTAPRGTIIKVTNPGTGKSVYAKVIGAVPGTASYHKAIAGVSSDARAALGVGDQKAWCELRYAK